MTKKRTFQEDYLKACRKASREEEIEKHGHPVGHRRVHVSKKIYNRKRLKAGWSLPSFLMTACA